MKLIEEDIGLIIKNNMKGPFLSTDDCSKNFLNYAQKLISSMKNDTINNIIKISNISRIEAEKQFNIFASDKNNQERFDKIGYSIHLEYITLLNFILFGKKTFIFENNLVEHLALTDISTKAKYINLPFESCMSVFNSPILLRSYYKISGISDYEEALDYKTPLCVFLTCLPSKEGLRNIIFSCHHANESRSYFSMKRELLVKENWSIIDMIKSDWEDIYNNSGDEESIENYVDEEVFYNNGMLFFRTVINALLYLSSNDPDIINVLAIDPFINEEEYVRLNKKEKAYVKKRLNYNTLLDHSIVGKNVGSIIVNKKKQNNNKNDVLNYSITKYLKFMVRGHWKNQAYGLNLSDRKLIWIKPYMKGNDLGEFIEKIIK
jgi:hypothetical protein